MHLTDPLTPALLKTNHPYIDGLDALGLKTVFDLLQYLPRAHEDLSEVMTLVDAPLGEKVTLRGTISKLKMINLGSRLLIFLLQLHPSPRQRLVTTAYV